MTESLLIEEVGLEEGTKLKRRRKSQIWDIFTIVDSARGRAICKYCSQVQSFKGGSTSNLSRHVKKRHPRMVTADGPEPDASEHEITNKGEPVEELYVQYEGPSSPAQPPTPKKQKTLVKTGTGETARKKLLLMEKVLDIKKYCAERLKIEAEMSQIRLERITQRLRDAECEVIE